MREPSVLAAALATAVALAGCSSAARRAPSSAPEEPPAVAEPTTLPSGDRIEWPGATADDLRLAAEVLDLTRRAFAALLPAAAPSSSVPVHVIVSDARQPLGSAYLLTSREVRIERRYVSRLNLAHETTHALLHARLGSPPPVWFDEAVAQLVAYRVVHGVDLAPPAGRPVGDFANLRALSGASWAAAGGAAYAEAARWLGYLLPSGPAPDQEKAAFARYVEELVHGADPAAADRELSAIVGAR